MLDRVESKAALPGVDESARNALHEEAMQTSNRAPESKPASQSASDQRKTDEAILFKSLYEKENFELDPIQKGQGPYQSLEQMKKEGKISLSEDQIISEAKRIQSRDEKDLGRDYYKTSDHIKRWSEQEIQNLVQDDVNKVKGIDVSNWQHNIDWKQVKDAGYQFAFMKATEGVTYVDSYFDANRKGAQDAGLKVGYYHYFHPENSVAEQVKLFTDVVGKAEPDGLRMVIDAEDPAMWRRYPVDQRVKMVEDFLQGVKEKVGITPQVCIYCSPSFADEILGNSPSLAKYSLWIANYGVDKPTIPDPWKKWDFWQYTSDGRVPGIDGRVDLDVFNGTDLNQDKMKA
jgi:lysozyme